MSLIRPARVVLGLVLALVLAFSAVKLVDVLTAAPAADAAVHRSRSSVSAAAPAAASPTKHVFNAKHPRHEVRRAAGARELGLRFSAAKAGQVTGIRVYRAAGDDRSHAVRLWSRSGRLLAEAVLPSRSSRGWQRAPLSGAMPIKARRSYVVSYAVRRGGRYATRPEAFASGALRRGPLVAYTGVWGRAGTFPKLDGPRSNYFVDLDFEVTRPGKTTGSFPDETNTGVPDGTPLTKYSGPCTITRTVTLDAVDASTCGALLIRAPGVVISRSVLPRVDATAGGSASVSITDSTVVGGNWSDGAVWGYGITLLRDEVTGGQHSVHCNDYCTVQDSWLHEQYNPSSESFHNNAFITNGGSHMVLEHNTLFCSAVLNDNDGGCTADVSLFGDFDPVDDVLVQNNLLRANDSSISYCAYGGYEPSKQFPVATNIRFVGNVFERGTNDKCGVFGAITSFQASATGNLWSGNVWSDGRPVSPK